MKTPIRFKAETKYQEAVAKKANTNLPIMARVGNHAAGVAAVPGRPSWYYIRIGDGTTGLSPNRLTQCKAEGIGLVLNDYIYVVKARDRNLTYYKFHSFIQNSAGTSPYPTTLIIPDNVAQAYSIVDDDSVGAGSPEYLRIVSTDGGQAVEFNFNNDDVDFIINANALANAFVLDGAAGGITLAGPSLTVPDDWWWGLGPATSRMEIEGTGINRFIIYSANLEMTGDDIWIPDNTADAMHIADQAAGVEGIEYQRFTTTDAQPVVIFNNGEVDVDFRIAGSGATNALFVRGSDGFVGFGLAAPMTAVHVANNGVADSIMNRILRITEADGTSGLNIGTDGTNAMMGVTDSNTDLYLLGRTGGVYSVAMTVVGATSKIGIRTQTVPHGGVGAAMLALDGTDMSAAAGPHIQITTAVDDYPLLQMFMWSHDNIGLNFDSYYDGAWKSSDAGSSFQIYKTGDYLRFRYDVAAAGAGITWNEGIVLDTNGRVFVGGGTIALAQLHVDQAGAAAAIPTLLLDQADLSEEFIEFTTTVGAGNPVDTAAIGAYYGKVRVSVTGVGFKYMALYNS